jgi:Fe2+ or Zn2+ uptake regulation protein
MQAQDTLTMREAAAVIAHALRAVGCKQPVELIDNGTAIRIGTYYQNLTILNENGRWQVMEYTPHLQRTFEYDTLEACAHDVAMCDETGYSFHQIDLAEHEIDDAIDAAEMRHR